MLQIDLFGTTKVHLVAGGPRDVDVCGVKPRQILEMLATRLGSPVTKDVLAEGLWAGRPPASYVASVESYVCVLRRSLAAVPGRPLVTTHGAYLLDPRLVRVDLVEARAGLAALESMSGRSLVEAAARALDAVAGELLAEEPFADWAAEVRRRLDQLVDRAVTPAAETALAAGDPVRACRLARAVLDRNPLSEPACRVLMSAQCAVGAPALALGAFADLRRVMVEELGVEPSGATRDLYLSVLDRSAPSVTRDRDRREVGALVRLLRQALDAGADPDPASRSWLAELGLTLAAPSA
ncbi:winged helix-turn-helix domain-containing protein [Nocardioides panacis]|uniref:Winged helix-turn-helix domain-containing protein n=1 Tax=Nocardioides panacis TaxID=2849501 RepID=A0A975T0Q1_9ACTN|nr:BTAD domain-containing putative transcriptional regulator [Nocardioides panacis]QWZ09449.1 winged helix-turn-helix domain-containing protein [Nocardioides panacis]